MENELVYEQHLRNVKAADAMRPEVEYNLENWGHSEDIGEILEDSIFHIVEEAGYSMEVGILVYQAIESRILAKQE